MFCIFVHPSNKRKIEIHGQCMRKCISWLINKSKKKKEQNDERSPMDIKVLKIALRCSQM